MAGDLRSERLRFTRTIPRHHRQTVSNSRPASVCSIIEEFRHTARHFWANFRNRPFRTVMARWRDRSRAE